jgi:hypothetical protein
MRNGRQETIFMSSKSMWQIHQEWVNELLARGEKVLQPKTGNPHGSIWGYIKSQVPHKDAGTIYKNRDNGMFEIYCDMCQYGVVGLNIEDIGLCDAKCWYEWIDDKVYNIEESECHKPDLKNVEIGDLVEELLSREDVTRQTVSWGKRLPDLSHDEWNLRTGPVEIIIIKTFERKDGYK